MSDRFANNHRVPGFVSRQLRLLGLAAGGPELELVHVPRRELVTNQRMFAFVTLMALVQTLPTDLWVLLPLGIALLYVALWLTALELVTEGLFAAGELRGPNSHEDIPLVLGGCETDLIPLLASEIGRKLGCDTISRVALAADYRAAKRNDGHLPVRFVHSFMHDGKEHTATVVVGRLASATAEA